MAKSNRRPLAALHIKLLRVLAIFIAKMRNISLNMRNHPELYATPSPSLDIFDANIDALEAAEAVASTKVTGSAALRDQAYDLVNDNVHNLQSYVQILADNAADEDDAKAIILNSGFDLKMRGVYIKPEFEAKNTDLSGIVELAAKSAGTDAAYEWRISQDGEVWTDLETTLVAKQRVSGLTKGSNYFFKYRTVTKAGTSRWSQSISLIVV
ncbi:MAG: fibronectin type III domain-containing protein [Bacteroidales bacterium]|nr:fibronectin type III domain-containing protein [Bacteroidales bacterium]